MIVLVVRVEAQWCGASLSPSVGSRIEDASEASAELACELVKASFTSLQTCQIASEPIWIWHQQRPSLKGVRDPPQIISSGGVLQVNINM